MKTIHKQVLQIVDKQTIEVPYTSNILSVAAQYGRICIWYACDDRSGLEKVDIYIFGTGNTIPNNFDGKFIGTVLMANDDLVWHVFRKI